MAFVQRLTMQENAHSIFITGGTGYMGSRLVIALLQRGHAVRALTRPESAQKLPAGAQAIVGDALSNGYVQQVSDCDTFINLVGVSHPSPAKAAQFRSVDLVALRHAVDASVAAKIPHFIYISVAHPAPVMKAYIEVRTECEAIIRESSLNATILRPWYVLGPGHRWPYALRPAYWLMERIPGTRESALRLGLVTLPQMLNALVTAVEAPCQGIRIMDVQAIRGGNRTTAVAMPS
ncbi:MAG TPA: NAD(P)H-binding protein [Candidatus Angelobacter sp.]|nr:NAD(P)H-binding protein [Candidatus Angelobacter sp.]